MSVFIAGTEVVRKDGESLSSAIMRTINENRERREAEEGPTVSVHNVPENKEVIVNKYSSDDSQSNVRALQDRLKKDREEKK